MKTDAIFYKLFQVAPQTFFELLQITPACPYRFESLTFKSTEKRIDGLLEPEEAGQPIYFIEVQAFPDQTIYWRTLRQTATFFEQRPKRKEEWQAIVLWLNKDDDPGFGPVPIRDENGRQRLFSIDLLGALKALAESSLVLNVLRPLIVDSEAEVRQNISEWVENIKSDPDLSAESEQRLITVLTQLIEQKFRTLNYKELNKMLRLTPFKETVSYKEALQEDIQEYSIEKLTRQIRRRFHFAESTIEKLRFRLQKLTLKELDPLFEDIFDMKTLRELNAWIDARLSGNGDGYEAAGGANGDNQEF